MATSQLWAVMVPLPKFDKIFWVGLRIMEYNIDGWRADTIHHTLVQLIWIVGLAWWSNHTMMAYGILPNQNLGHVHVFYAIAIGPRISISCRVACCCCKVGAISKPCCYRQDTNASQINFICD